jgi:small subunit ribosomal protein S6
MPDRNGLRGRVQMPTETPLYDLMLLLSNDAEEERRAKIIDDVRKTISSGGGSIAHDDEWGTRPLAYRIAHQSDAEYHLLQFTGPPSLLDSLGHSLGITDGVLRFRIIKVLPGTPGPPKPEPAATSPPPRAEPAPASPPPSEEAPAPSEAPPSEESTGAVAEGAPAAEASTPAAEAEAPSEAEPAE